uniref:O-acetyltransferase dmxR13 n=1 Tax=Cryptosporiopsis sp. (strain 8999) TaxID=2572248 RepID=DMR13_CRYX8|nr:RecName: Full=O-acetyltransferase dmxR13; AltName: Full=Dimeric xanthone biosynthesis cluster protein R13 [Cryptosporiopsis sp. 8999]QCL09104.1 DmxR13 [Cryptosporiopsis sp. 8999]
MGSAIDFDLDGHLDILGQQPLLQMYTQICFAFPVADSSSYSAITKTLADGLERLSASFPWVAGHIVNEDSGEGNTGVFKIKPLDKSPSLIVKDFRNDPSFPTMEAIKKAGFPFSMLNEDIIAPRKTLPVRSDTPEISPVLVVQADLITGGLLLVFAGQHNAMDMTGQGQVIHLFSKACRNEPFTSDELVSGNLDRRTLVPLLDDSYKQGHELARQISQPRPPPSSDGPPPPKLDWTYILFSPTSLAELKSLAQKTITFPSSFISTDDTLSAFVWQAVARSRLPRFDASAKTTCARAVDVRSYLGVPSTYTGLLQNVTYDTFTLQKLVNEPLGSVASALRSGLDPKRPNDLGFSTRALVTVLSRTLDKNTFSFGGTVNPSLDFMVSSWAKLDSYELDFGLGLGKPEGVRRPQFQPLESLGFLMPKTQDGEIAFALCLMEEDMKRLRADEEFTKYGVFVG